MAKFRPRCLAEAAAKDLRNAPRGRVASLMESWEEDWCGLPVEMVDVGVFINWGIPQMDGFC